MSSLNKTGPNLDYTAKVLPCGEYSISSSNIVNIILRCKARVAPISKVVVVVVLLLLLVVLVVLLLCVFL